MHPIQWDVSNSVGSVRKSCHIPKIGITLKLGIDTAD